MVKIDFENTYNANETASDLSYMIFHSEVSNTPDVILKAEISPLNDPLLPGVYNLSFGPIKGDGNIDDAAKINHADKNKVFSTILLYALVYLQDNPHATIGVDGSDDVRAYLYHRMFLTNQAYLDEYFTTIGVDWYVKLLRNGGDVERDEHGYPYFKPRPEPFDYQRNATNLYRYYMFRLRQ